MISDEASALVADPDDVREARAVMFDLSTARSQYADAVQIDRIVVDHRVMGGVPCVRGTRVPVVTVLAMVADGMTADEIVADYPQLTPEDVRAVLQYAVRSVDERELPVRFSA